MTVFVIEDEAHAEWCGEFESFELALTELKRRAEIPWDSSPNRCPCMSWKTCSRSYDIIEFDNSRNPWEEKDRTPILEISSNGSVWANNSNT